MNSETPQVIYDVFLCHNHFDKPKVLTIKEELVEAGIRTFLDELDLPLGHRWGDYLPVAMDKSSSSAIFIGDRGLGNTQKKEILHLRGNWFIRDIPFIPVYLPNAPQIIQLPDEFDFLVRKDYLGVDFRSGGDPDPIGKLIRAIRGTQNDRAGSTHPPTQEDDLRSERGIDYKPLRDLLKAQNWKAADKETLKVMLQAAGSEEERWLNTDSIENFPCTDLRTIDQLWVKYSNEHFGFSVQKRIWLKCGGRVDYETEKVLGEAVGWRKNDSWKWSDDITFNLDAPTGHLPWFIFMWLFDLGFGWGCSSLASRLVECNI